MPYSLRLFSFFSDFVTFFGCPYLGEQYTHHFHPCTKSTATQRASNSPTIVFQNFSFCAFFGENIVRTCIFSWYFHRRKYCLNNISGFFYQGQYFYRHNILPEMYCLIKFGKVLTNFSKLFLRTFHLEALSDLAHVYRNSFPKLCIADTRVLVEYRRYLYSVLLINLILGTSCACYFPAFTLLANNRKANILPVHKPKLELTVISCCDLSSHSHCYSAPP